MSLPSSTIEITWPMPGAGNRTIVSCILPPFFLVVCVYFRSSSAGATLNSFGQCLNAMRVLLLPLKRVIGVGPMCEAHLWCQLRRVNIVSIVFNNFPGSFFFKKKATEAMHDIILEKYCVVSLGVHLLYERYLLNNYLIYICILLKVVVWRKKRTKIGCQSHM